MPPNPDPPSEAVPAGSAATPQRMQLRERTWLRVGPFEPGSNEEDIMAVLTTIGCHELPSDHVIWTPLSRDDSTHAIPTLTPHLHHHNVSAPNQHTSTTTTSTNAHTTHVEPPLHVYVRFDVPSEAEAILTEVQERRIGHENGQQVPWDVVKIPMRDVLRELRTVAVHPDAHRDPSPAIFPLTRLGNCIVLRGHDLTCPGEVLRGLSGLRAYALHMEGPSRCIVEMEDAIEAIRAQRRQIFTIDGREVHAELANESDLRCPRPVLYATVLLSGLPASTDVPSLVSSVLEGSLPPSPSSSSTASRSTRASVVSGGPSSAGAGRQRRSTRPAYSVGTILRQTLLHVFLIFSSPSAARQARSALHDHFALPDATSEVQVVLCSADTPSPPAGPLHPLPPADSNPPAPTAPHHTHYYPPQHPRRTTNTHHTHTQRGGGHARPRPAFGREHRATTYRHPVGHTLVTNNSHPSVVGADAGAVLLSHQVRSPFYPPTMEGNRAMSAAVALPPSHVPPPQPADDDSTNHHQRATTPNTTPSSQPSLYQNTPSNNSPSAVSGSSSSLYVHDPYSLN